MLLSTAYHIIQLVVTVMGIIVAFTIAFTTGNYLSKGEKTREIFYIMGQRYNVTKEKRQEYAKSIFDIDIMHLKKERNWWFFGLGIIAVLIFQSLFWDVNGLSLLFEIILLISTVLGISWTFLYARRTINMLIKHFKGYGKNLFIFE